MTTERIDVLAVYDAAIFQRRRRLRQITDKAWPQRAIERQEAHLAAAIESRAAVAELIEANRKLTAAVRAFADGEMSSDVRDRLFLSKHNGPEQETFGTMCEANDAAEAALSRVGAP